MLLNGRIPAKYIINKVKYDLLNVLILSTIVIFFTANYRNVLPEMPLTIPTFIGTAISILLSFKLNQSYDRWWEARKIWGSIVNDSRSLVIQLQSFINAGNESTIRKIAFRQIAWCYSLGQSLRGLNPLENINELISSEEIEACKLHINKPLSLLQLHAVDIKALKENNQLDTFSHVELNRTLVKLCEYQGQSERIKSTIFPVTYRMFLHAIIYLFVVTLSIALKNVGGIYEIPLLLLISAAFFLLERSATHMQDPFENRPTDTAITAIARTIEINIKQLLKEPTDATLHKPEKFYIL